MNEERELIIKDLLPVNTRQPPSLDKNANDVTAIRWEDNIKMDLRDTVCKDMDCICLVHDTDKWWSL
jgi:hypothetical protein